MRYRLFGRTGLRVSELLLGTMTLRDEQQARRILDVYAEAGGNVLDTASAYGESEAVLGAVIERRDRFVIGTKYTLSRDAADPNAAGNHRKNLVLSLEQSLRRLRTDHVDIFWVHLWDRHTPVEETMRALDDVVRAGKVLYVGASDAPAWFVARANTLAEWRDWTPFAGLQVPYNLLRRDVERELLPMAEALGMSVAAWAPLAAGVLSGGSTRVGELTPRDQAAAAAVRKVAEELGATPAQVALAWTRAKSPAVLPLVGVSRPEQLADNLGALDLVLPAEAVTVLESAAGFERGFPADFIAECEPSRFAFGDAATKVVGR
ncbi:aldo/keto reductase [Actinophytocola algeriensis]|uniref:Aryl-alcohol dehydrogenase-like predicted oxidoreductase n=1 Tax=Actinophytocola algeriensis TaxID=1768010 RepID=A0A7W7VGT6_9PSEU|nr:aldo/keto reductase [Actinophytocola algeriensis]MBB4909688.1 aryl-alcohol dehydrogenase-like predicted oxidoreductase [Actinophytocola algeriensis]MBE1475678.1 aryl-alcohol dehydrogenase-like predicted oxidoreductase [Actinophytocola algeriensis]